MTLCFLSVLFSSRTTGCVPCFLFPEQQLPKDSQVSTVPSLQVPRQALQRFPRARVEKLPTLIDAKRPSHPKVPNSAVSKVPNSYRFQVSNGKVAKAASAEVATVPIGMVPTLPLQGSKGSARHMPPKFFINKVPKGFEGSQ